MKLKDLVIGQTYRLRLPADMGGDIKVALLDRMAMINDWGRMRMFCRLTILESDQMIELSARRILPLEDA